MPIIKPPTPRLRAGHPLNRGLVGAWLLNEGSGALVRDLAGNNHGRTSPVTQAPDSVAAGRNGPALLFNGTNQYVDLGPGPYLPRFTIAAWVYPTSFSGGFRSILARGNSSVRNYALDLESGTGKPRLYFTQGANQFKGFSASVALPLNAWSFVVGTFDGATSVIYINGLRDSSSAQAFTPDDPGSVLYLGLLSGDGSSWFAGRISEARLWNRPLLPAEVQSLYRGDYAELRPPEAAIFPKLTDGFEVLRLSDVSTSGQWDVSVSESISASDAASAAFSNPGTATSHRLAAEVLLQIPSTAVAGRLAAEVLLGSAASLQAGTTYVEALTQSQTGSLQAGTTFVEVMGQATGVTEFLLLSDEAIADGILAKSQSEAINLHETISYTMTVGTETVTEAMTLADTIKTIYNVSQTETMSLSDNVSLDIPLQIFNEAVSLADSTNSTATRSASVAEAVAIADQATSVVPTDVGEAVTLADAVDAVGTHTASVAESISLADFPDSLVFNLTVDEAVALADAAVPHGTYNVPVAESMALGEAEDRSLADGLRVGEGIALADASPPPVLLRVINVYEVMVLKEENLSGPFVWARDLTESMDLRDLGDQTVHAAPVAEAMALADASGSSATYAEAVAEAISAADHVGAYPVTPSTGEYPSAAVTVLG